MSSERYAWRTMPKTSKRATIYFDPDLHTALRLKAATTDRSLSDIVNEAVAEALHEDQEDLAEFAKRADEPTLSYEQFLDELKSLGKI
jgi:plasmid stability protein